MSPSPFEDKKNLPNPFGRLVGDPLADGIDVAEINVRAFEACRRLIEQVREQGASGGLALIGEAGAGKTHLLGRVRRWLQEIPDSLFVPVRMDTSAQMLWRHLRRNLADALLRPSKSGRRAIDDLLGRRLAEVSQLAERDLSIVLENLLRGMHVRDTAAWLRGQDLPEAVLESLKLAQPGPDEDREVNSRHVVVELCSLIEPGTVVFCLDQWEALQSYTGENDGLQRAGQAVSLLHDPPVRNACIISCLQTGFLPQLEKGLDVAIRQRMLGTREAIDLLDWDKARRLIVALLDSPAALRDVRKGHDDPLWPLAETPIQAEFRGGQSPARNVISRCKVLFDEWRTGITPREVPVEEALQTMLEERFSHVGPEDAEGVLRNGLPVVFRALGAGLASAPKGSPFDFVTQGGRQVIALCNQTNSRALASRLKKISQAWKGSNSEQLLLMRDARLPVSPTARVTRQHLEALEKEGGRLVPVSQEAIETLAALRRLLDDAQSSDLPVPADRNVAETVKQWIAGHLPVALDPLIAEIGSPDRLSGKLADLLAQKRIISLEEAARELQTRPVEVETCARRDPRLFGMLGGPTPALFQPIRAEPPSGG